MAKFVIAGRSDCPYFARAELLGDRLKTNLPDFKVHKIVKTEQEWEDWLLDTCMKHGWEHSKSPLVWRELIDRGGKGVLIGGANEFQEYAAGYYGLQSDLNSNDMRKIAAENCQTKIEVDEEERLFRSESNPLQVCISSASSNVSYGMINRIAQGEVFGADTEISLRLLDSSSQQGYLEGVAMEATDLAQGLLRDVLVTDNPHQAFADCSVIILLDEIEQDAEEERSVWLQRNAEHFSNLAKVISESCEKEVKVMIAGEGPVNLNTFMLIHNAPGIPRHHFVGLSRMVENHAKSVLAGRLKVNSVDVVDVVVWGNVCEAGGNYVDLSRARVHNYNGAVWGPPFFSLPVLEMLHDNKWAETEFPPLVHQRPGLVEGKLGHRATISRAAAVTSMVAHWWNGSPTGQIFSLAVASEGWYGVPEGLVFSYPVTMSPQGDWHVVQDIAVTAAGKEQINTAVESLLSEKYVIFPPPRLPSPEPPSPPSEVVPADVGAAETPSEGTQTVAETVIEGETTAVVQETKPEAEVTESRSAEQGEQTEPAEDPPETEPEA